MPGQKWKSPLLNWDEYNQNPNLAFTLVARNERAKQMWADPHNISRYVPASFTREKRTDWSDREPTPTMSDAEKDKDTEPALKFYFNNRPKDFANGYVLGSNEKQCDVLLGDPGSHISQKMLAFTFNQNHELIMNVTSANPTSVEYNEQKKAKREHFSWIFPPYQIMIHVKVANALEFDVVIPKYGINEHEFHENCQSFLNSAADAESLEINSKAATTKSSVTSSLWDPFYLLGTKLGSGTYGEVSKALRMPDGKTFAAKSFKHNHLSFRKEVDMLKWVCEVPHKNIVQFVEEWHGDNEPLMIMEYVAGGTLRERMRSDMDLADIKNLANQMLAALVFLCDRDVMHRDIKPANILCVTPSHYKLADFGVAKEVTPLLSKQGTCAYMAPEVLVLSSYTFSADIWSLGVVLFECLEGDLPAGCPEMEGRKWCEKIYKKFTVHLRECDEDRKEGEPAEITHLVQQAMLRLDPEERLSARRCLDVYPHLWKGLDGGEASGGESGAKTPTKAYPNGSHVPDALESSGDDEAREAGSLTVRRSGGEASGEGRAPQNFRNEDRSTVAHHSTVELIFPTIPYRGESSDPRGGMPYDPDRVEPNLSFVSDSESQEHSIPDGDAKRKRGSQPSANGDGEDGSGQVAAPGLDHFSPQARAISSAPDHKRGKLYKSI